MASNRNIFWLRATLSEHTSFWRHAAWNADVYHPIKLVLGMPSSITRRSVTFWWLLPFCESCLRYYDTTNHNSQSTTLLIPSTMKASPLAMLIILFAMMMSSSHAFRNVVISPLRRSLSTIRLAAVNGDTSINAKTVTSLDPVPEHAHRLVLMRHGESEFNNANVFTGWSDIGTYLSVAHVHCVI